MPQLIQKFWCYVCESGSMIFKLLLFKDSRFLLCVTLKPNGWRQLQTVVGKSLEAKRTDGRLALLVTTLLFGFGRRGSFGIFFNLLFQNKLECLNGLIKIKTFVTIRKV